MTNYEKAFISLRYWMLGRGMHDALRALEFASKFHTGTRKDGVTPEYFHQLSICQFLRTLISDTSNSGLLFPQETLAVSCLHDTMEDADVSYEELSSLFGERIAISVRLLTKQFRGVKVAPERIFADMSKCPIASIVKGGDRINNQGSMVGVFTTEKQKSYVEETTIHILPMLKRARREFTKQEAAYENIKFILRGQIDMISAIHQAAKQ